mgnify:CR=1 FL=1
MYVRNIFRHFSDAYSGGEKLGSTAKLMERQLITNTIFTGHLKNAEEFGLLTYLRNPLFMMRNTDGPGNPYSKVYDRHDIAADFAEFNILESRVHFLNERHLPILKLLPQSARSFLASRFGWHLWATLT